MSNKNFSEELRVGDRVVLTLAGRDLVAEVIEDRGPIGVGGRRLLRVRWIPEGVDEPIEFEQPADGLRRAG